MLLKKESGCEGEVAVVAMHFGRNMLSAVTDMSVEKLCMVLVSSKIFCPCLSCEAPSLFGGLCGPLSGVREKAHPGNSLVR